MSTVTVYGDNFEKAIRKFKKKVSESKLLEEARSRAYYEKPSLVRKHKRAAAEARQRKKLRESTNPPKLF